MDLTAALTTVTAVGELTKLVVSGKIDSEVKAKAAELNNAILALQGTLFSLQSQNQELLNSKREVEEKLINASNWNNTAEKYQLHELCSGVFVFALKENKESPEPFHYICPNCYTSQKQSFLVKSEKSHSGISYSCRTPECGAKYNDYSNKKPVPTPQPMKFQSPFT